MSLMGAGFLPEIINAYGGLRASMRKQIDRGVDEQHLLALLVYGCFIIFLSFIPRLLATDLSQTPDQSIAGGIIMWFFVVMFFLPLVLYGVAAFTHLIAKAFNASGSYFAARHALFWMLAVLSPILIVKALLASVFIQINGDSSQNLLDLLNIILSLSVLRIWGATLAEAEGFKSSAMVSGAIFLILAAISGAIYIGTI